MTNHSASILTFCPYVECFRPQGMTALQRAAVERHSEMERLLTSGRVPRRLLALGYIPVTV